MAIPVASPKALLADKGYDGDRFRESLLIRGILPIIPPRSNRKVPEHPRLSPLPGPATASSACSASSNSSVASPPATTRPFSRSKASSTSPPPAYG